MVTTVYKVFQLLAIFLAFLVTVTSGQDNSPPNIILVIADDLGYRDIGYHGSDIYTPNLDELAASGVKLENYYVQPTCSPSRSQLMTGKYQIRMGIQHGTFRPCQLDGLPLNHTTIAEVLQEKGYATHYIGKWHLGFLEKEYLPTRRGFDTFYGNLNGYSDHFKHATCRISFSRVVKVFNYPLEGSPCGYTMLDGETPDRSARCTYSTHAYTNKAQTLISGAKTAGKPIFMVVSYQAPHSPVQAPGKYYTHYKNIANKDRQVYAGMVETVDEGVKNITDTLKAEGMWDNTVLVFMSDNGGDATYGGLNWPLRGSKGNYWEGGIKVVGFVASPLISDKQKGAVSEQLMHITDWMPTIADIAGATAPEGDGISQWQMIKDGEPTSRTEILHNIDTKIKPLGKLQYKNTFDHRVHAGIRVGDFKLLTGNQGITRMWLAMPPPGGVRNLHAIVDGTMGIPKGMVKEKDNLFLFNIKEDPRELVNLKDKNPDKVKELLGRLQFYKEKMEPQKLLHFNPFCEQILQNGVWSTGPNANLRYGPKGGFPIMPGMMPPGAGRGKKPKPPSIKVNKTAVAMMKRPPPPRASKNYNLTNWAPDWEKFLFSNARPCTTTSSSFNLLCGVISCFTLYMI